MQKNRFILFLRSAMVPVGAFQVLLGAVVGSPYLMFTGATLAVLGAWLQGSFVPRSKRPLSRWEQLAMRFVALAMAAALVVVAVSDVSLAASQRILYAFGAILFLMYLWYVGRRRLRS